jgi:hypothetical protein
MPHWLVKAAVQRAISWLPASHKWNYLFQQHVTRSLELTPDRFEMRLNSCRRHLDHFLGEHSNQTRSFTALEVGTGWLPVVPVGFFLCGATEVWSFDIAPLLTPGGLRKVFHWFDEYARSGRLQRHLPRLLPERLARLGAIAALYASPHSRGSGESGRSGAATAAPDLSAGPVPSGLSREDPTVVLEQLHIHLRVRGAQDTGLPSKTVDLFTSTGVLQYIPGEVIKSMLAEFTRLGTASSVQSHYVNLVDQYSSFDKSISPLNFLQYSPRQWDWLNSSLTWLNRLRISDYRALFTQAGFKITSEINTSGGLEVLERLRLAPQFSNYSADDLLVFNSWIVAQPVGR